MTVARTSEIIAASEKGFDDAIRQGIERSVKTLRNVKAAWIKEQEVTVENDQVTRYKVTMKVTFVLDD